MASHTTSTNPKNNSQKKDMQKKRENDKKNSLTQSARGILGFALEILPLFAFSAIGSWAKDTNKEALGLRAYRV